MLSKIIIKNFTLIDSLSVDFSNNLNVITGETGAGKSIILGALGLALGERTDVQQIRDISQKALIEAEFYIRDYNLQHFFEENELDYADEIFVRRELQSNGKSRAFVNDTPVNVSTLKQLGEALIDIHAQNDTQRINEQGFQLNVLDAVCNHTDLIKTYRIKYSLFKQWKYKLEEALRAKKQLQLEYDFIQYQYNELNEIKLDDIDEITLQQELQTNEHAESIKRALSKTHFLLNDNEQDVRQILNEVINELNAVAKFNGELQEMKSRLHEIQIEIKEIARNAENIAESLEYNAERAEEINAILYKLNLLYKKHQVTEKADLISLRDNLLNKLNLFAQSDETIQQLESEIQHKEKELLQIAKTLHENRFQHIETVNKTVTEFVRQLGMEHAIFEANLSEIPFNENGISHVEFTFSANKGNSLKPLRHVASGGEKSRLMLVIKSILAQYQHLPTIIFDEIDTGVSGETARKMGRMLQQLAEHLQIICITHLPQIAVNGQHHYFVYKDNSSDKTASNIKKLDKNERITEIAKMLSGDPPTESAMTNAKELLMNNV